ncbi:MAG: RDD family protein [Nitrososphaerota archaeon]
MVILDLGFVLEHRMEIINLTVSYYSIVFVVTFIVLSALESYKGQTLGKYLMRIRVVKTTSLKVSPMEAVIRNVGKIFLLPIDLIHGLVIYRRRGFLRFFDYYTQTRIERVYT